MAYLSPVTSCWVLPVLSQLSPPTRREQYCCLDRGTQSFLNFNLLPLYFPASFAARSSRSQINSLREEGPVLLLVKVLELETGNKAGP